ncbi:DUF4160 domain-containing protein [Spirosoma fluminis]
MLRDYYRDVLCDHNPPHFHAKYGDSECLISINDLSLLEGKLSSRALGMVIERTIMHQEELLLNWELAKNLKPLNIIEPLS